MGHLNYFVAKGKPQTKKVMRLQLKSEEGRCGERPYEIREDEPALHCVGAATLVSMILIRLDFNGAPCSSLVQMPGDTLSENVAPRFQTASSAYSQNCLRDRSPTVGVGPGNGRCIGKSPFCGARGGGEASATRCPTVGLEARRDIARRPVGDFLLDHIGGNATLSAFLKANHLIRRSSCISLPPIFLPLSRS